MSEPASAPARPPQVTVAAWVVMVGCALVVLMMWDRIAALHSLTSRESLQSMLDDPGLRGLNLQVTDVMAVVRTLSMVAAGCATAMVILGYQTLQRSRPARLALTVLTVPLFVTGLVTGGFLSSAVAAATASLWLGPARAWFRGEAVARTAEPRREPAAFRTTPAQTPDPLAPPPSGVSAAQPAAAQPSAAQPSAAQPSAAQPSAEPAPYVGEWGAPATSAYSPDRPERNPVDPVDQGRPVLVLWACGLTWVFAGLATLVLVGTIVVLGADSASVLDKMHAKNPSLTEQGISDHLILVICLVTTAALLVWSLAALVVAAFVVRRARWAWYGLVFSTVGVIGISLLGALGSLMMLVPLAAAAAVITMLVRPETRRWFGVR